MAVSSLFDTCLNFVVMNINLVESFEGFPQVIGEKIFRKFALEYSMNSTAFHLILKKFVEAYEKLILERLSLFNSLLILDEHFESFAILLQGVKELCLCNCYLGESHEIICRVAEFHRLKKLCLRDNSMNDTSIRLLTLRIRMFGVGCKEIEHLDLSGNHFTDAIIPWLKVFPKLEYLNLSGSDISNEGIKTLTSQHDFKRIFTCEQHENIVNEGWATTLLERWNSDFSEARSRKIKKFLFREIIEPEVFCLPSYIPQNLSSNIPLIFQKLPQLKDLAPPNKKMKLSESSKNVYL